MDELTAFERACLDPKVGAACVQRIELLIHRVKTGPPGEARGRLAEAHRSFGALGVALAHYSAHQREKQHYAASSTATAMLRTALQFVQLPAEEEEEAEEDDGLSPDEWYEQFTRSIAEDEKKRDEAAKNAPDPAVVAAEQAAFGERELSLAVSPENPFAQLPEGPWEVRFQRVLYNQYETVAEVRLEGPAGAWLVYLAGFGQLLGRASLTGARFESASHHGCSLVGAEGSLSISGQAWIEPSSPQPPPSPLGQADSTRWVALVDRINDRARWDYEIEESEENSISIRGTSGHYESGCAIQLLGVTAFDLPQSFRHAVFRLVGRAQLPVHARSAPGVALGFEADVSFSESRLRYVIATAARFEDDGEVCEAPAVDSPPPAPAAWPPLPLALGRAARPEAAGLRAALHGLLAGDFPADRAPAALAVQHAHEALLSSDLSDDYLALASAPPDNEQEGIGKSSTREASGLVAEILAVLSDRASLAAGATGDHDEDEPGAVGSRLAPPLAPAPEREAAVRAARAWLTDALPWLSREAKEAATRDLSLLVVEPPSERIRGDARALAASTAVRRPLGLWDRAVALDLAHLTVGRVLFDPAAEASRSAEERLAHAAGLLALDAIRDPSALSLARMLPDPAARDRMSAAAPLLVRLGPAIDQLAAELCDRAALDLHEVILLLDEEPEALRLYRLLRAALLGDPAAR